MKVKKSDAELYNAERDAYVTKLEASLLTLTAERDAEVRRARTAEAECERMRRESAEAFSEFLLADSGMDMTNYLRLYRAALAAGEK